MIRDKHLAICASLNAPKSQYNSFGKYSYRSCEDILEAVKPLLVEHGVMLHITDSIEVFGEGDHQRAYVIARVWLQEVETGDTSPTSTAYARLEDTKKGMDGSQITGTASSYARKYALNALFLIDDSKDADTDESQGRASEPKEKSVSSEFFELLKKTSEQFGCTEQDVKDAMAFAGLSKMSDGIAYMRTAMQAGTLALGLED